MNSSAPSTVSAEIKKRLMPLLIAFGVSGLALGGWAWWEMSRAANGVALLLDASLKRVADTAERVTKADVFVRRHPDGGFWFAGPGLAVRQLKPGDLDGVRQVLAKRRGARVALLVMATGTAATPRAELREILPPAERTFFESVSAVIVQQVVEPGPR